MRPFPMLLPTARLLALFGAALWLLSSAAAAQGVSSGGPANGGASPDVTPFDPASNGGGIYSPPPDQGTPNNGADNGKKKGNTRQDERAVGQTSPTTGRSSRGGQSGAARAGASAAATGMRFDLGDSWVQWWETNKFDFIRLRRVRDTPITGQGQVEETADEREARIQATERLVRSEVIPVLRELTEAQDAAVRASAVVALAKLQDTEGPTVARELLKDKSFGVRRASMLAMGVLEAGRSSYFLMNIADDSALGRQLLQTNNISDEDRGIALLTAALRGHRAPEALVDRLLTDESDLPNEILASACDAAGLMESVQAIAPLTTVALDTSRPGFVRAAATTALGRLGDPGSVPALLKILDSGLEPQRSAAAALGLAGHQKQPAVVKRLASLLENTDGPTRHFAAISLGRIGGEQARSALLSAFKNPKADMRAWLALGLGLCERQRPLGQIPELLIDRYENEANSETAGAYLIALGLCGRDDMGNFASTLPWDRILKTLESALQSNRSHIAGHAALALGLTGHPDAGSKLEDALKNSESPEVQRQVALGLGVLGDSEAIPSLLQLMRNTNNPYVASFAALGIAFMGDANVIGPLMHMIDRAGPNGLTTTYAVAAVGQLFDSERRPTLSRLASGDNYLARTSSVQQLLALGF
ncbi:MAG: HEAT repeat domain-containing protein [Planctomycetota bacterium]|nr:HEAT repeat domain-containing protein [Planctomycetota bacterium]